MIYDKLNTLADTAVLPRSGALLYSSDISQYAEDYSYANSVYVEQPLAQRYLLFGENRIEPNGPNNNFPYDFKNLLDRVYIAHGVKRTLINLLLSGGVALYKPFVEDKKIIKDWQLNSQITDWLESWDFFTKYLPEAATDMVYVENMWTAFLRNKGANIGQKPFIASLEYLPAEEMRLEYPDAYGNRKKVFRSDWMYRNLHGDDIVSYPTFDKRNPFKNKTSVLFNRMPTFGSQGYGRPSDIGATQMLEVLALMPAFHKANLTERGFKWIVAISSDYYESVREKSSWSEESKEWQEWKRNFQSAIDEFLVAPEADKVQTRFMTEYKMDRFSGKPTDAVKIEKLEDDTKELSEVGISLNNTYTAGYASSVSLSPELANIHLPNHSLSGSNLREAYEMHINTAAPTMRLLLLDAVNTAIKINFPKLGLKLGFQDVAFADYADKNTVKTSLNTK